MGSTAPLFKAVDELVKSWATGDYVHHVRHLRDRDDGAQDFLVIFSIPEPSKPVPEHVAQATFHVVPPPPDDEEGVMKITYTVETQKQRLPSRLPIRKAWLDAAVRRKRMVGASSQMFAQTGRLPTPQAFVPGMYKAQAAIEAEAMDGLEANEERLQRAMHDLDDMADVEQRNLFETDEELEQLLVSIFNDADKDGNGYLDRGEFSQLLDTAELGLEQSEKIALLSMADCNGDGHIEYKEVRGRRHAAAPPCGRGGNAEAPRTSCCGLAYACLRAFAACPPYPLSSCAHWPTSADVLLRCLWRRAACSSFLSVPTSSKPCAYARRRMLRPLLTRRCVACMHDSLRPLLCSRPGCSSRGGLAAPFGLTSDTQGLLTENVGRVRARTRRSGPRCKPGRKSMGWVRRT